MAQYRITTDQWVVTIDGPDDATEQELNQAVEEHFNPPAPAEPNKPPQPAQRTDLEAATNVVQGIRHGQTEDLGQVGKDVLQLTSAPFRGLRGLTVGLGRLGTEPVGKTVQRAAEAVKPGFEPATTGEKLASASSGLLEVAAPLGQASRTTRLGRGMTELATLKGTAARIAKLKQSVGVATDLAVQPIRGAKEATTFVNSVTNLRKNNVLKALGPQELHEVEVKLRNLLDAEKVGKFARLLGKKPKGLLTDQAVQLATKAKTAVVKAQNEITPGLEGARRTYGDVAARNRLVKRAALLGAAEVGRRVIGQPATSVVTEVAR